MHFHDVIIAFEDSYVPSKQIKLFDYECLYKSTFPNFILSHNNYEREYKTLIRSIMEVPFITDYQLQFNNPNVSFRNNTVIPDNIYVFLNNNTFYPEIRIIDIPITIFSYNDALMYVVIKLFNKKFDFVCMVPETNFIFNNNEITVPITNLFENGREIISKVKHVCEIDVYNGVIVRMTEAYNLYYDMYNKGYDFIITSIDFEYNIIFISFTL